MEQLLFELPPRSHTLDPATSKEAEAKSASLRVTHTAIVLGLVRMYPGLTSTALAELAARHPAFTHEPHRRLYQVRRRLSDLRIAGLVRIDGRSGGESVWIVAR